MLSVVQEVIAHWIAECRLMIEQTRLLTLNAAHALDTLGSRAARKEVRLFLTLTFKKKQTNTYKCPDILLGMDNNIVFLKPMASLLHYEFFFFLKVIFIMTYTILSKVFNHFPLHI